MKHSIKCSAVFLFSAFFIVYVPFTTGARLKGKIVKTHRIDFRPETVIMLPDSTGFIQSDIPYQMIRWDFKTMKELGSTDNRQAATVALLYDGHSKIYRITYQGIEIYNASTGNAIGDMRPYKATALGGTFDQESGNLIAFGTKSVFFVDAEKRTLTAETPITVGGRILGASTDERRRLLYVFMQPGEDKHALVVPVDLDRFTAGKPIDLGEVKKFASLLYAKRPRSEEGHEQFYFSGTGEGSGLYIKVVDDAQSEIANIKLSGGAAPPKMVFSPDGEYLVAFEQSGFSVNGAKGNTAGLGN